MSVFQDIGGLLGGFADGFDRAQQNPLFKAGMPPFSSYLQKIIGR